MNKVVGIKVDVEEEVESSLRTVDDADVADVDPSPSVFYGEPSTWTRLPQGRSSLFDKELMVITFMICSRNDFRIPGCVQTTYKTKT